MGMHRGAVDLLALIGLGVLVLALLRANGRKVFVVVSGGTGVALLAIAALIGHAG